MPFDRWISQEATSWPYRCLVHYYDDINRMSITHRSTKEYIYPHLKAQGALWDSPAYIYLPTLKNNQKLTIKKWSENFNSLSDWILLNCLMSLTSVYETYIESVIWLALESDPGVIVGLSRSVDGIKLLKEGKVLQRKLINDKVTACTHGTWQSRIAQMKAIFGEVPQVFYDELSTLEKIRKFRNQVGHAFGRDIKEIRHFDQARPLPMKKITFNFFRKSQSVIRRTSRLLDLQLTRNHIGDFLALYFYHNHYAELAKHPILTNRHHYLKSMLGKHADHVFTKQHCKWLIDYYENL